MKVFRRALVMKPSSFILHASSLLLPALLALTSLGAEKPAESVITRRTADSGVAVELTMRHAAGESSSAPFREGDEVAVSVKIADEKSGAPVSGVFPSAWMSARHAGEPEAASKRCTQKVATFTAGDVFRRAEVDLNVYHVIVLNDDPTISVVDPHFSFGGTQLLAMLPLKSAGDDWALADDQQLLLVSMPAAGRVAVIDTPRWRVLREIDAGPEPRRIAAQPDDELIWVATAGGATAIRRDGVSIAARVATGDGPHDLAVSGDNRWVFVTNGKAGTTSVIDVHSFRKAGDIASGSWPASVSWSALGGEAVVTGTDGTITLIDPVAHHSASLKTQPGIDRIRFSPGGRFGFIPNRTGNTVQILDVTSGRIVQTAAIDGGPFEVTFTSQLAYVRREKSEVVQMIPLAELGKEGSPVPVVDFPAGQKPFGAARTPADGVVPVPGENAVIVANAADRSIYYYKEGMAAPMGTFGNAGHEPRALLVFDRTLRERKPGVYTTSVRLGRPGDYDFALLVDSPRIVACLDVAVAPNAGLEAQRRPPLLIEPVSVPRSVRAGETVTVRLRLRDTQNKQPRDGLKDVQALVSLSPGVWQERHVLTPAGGGEYTFTFVSPEAGTYMLYPECPSAGLRFSQAGVLTIEAHG